MEDQKQKEFEELVKPVMKYLAENHHPHKRIIITSSDAELVEGQMAFATSEFIPD